MKFSIVKPEGVVYEDEIEKVTIPTESGEITVLPEHEPMVSVLKPGIMTVYKNGNIIELATAGGVLEIRPSNELYIIADSAEKAEEIDIERAEKAKKRAEELLKQEQNLSDVDFARIQVMIEKEVARISLGKKYRKLR